MAIDRTEVSRALAKALAFKAYGKDRDAEIWAARLIDLLECAEILNAKGQWAAQLHTDGKV